ncbi:MAG: polysulfide reductase NrfD [Ignavibacteria bacterium]|nr:polysulfide reductase NrfD [Ignavibacteria bacterium]MBT8381185.1 polysulfide reductase NrfD [Ignavibacteria bacterium]MBT8392982.1 polysulfide reductase NrfD [Ignavibacteria bacterium]NNJ53866.1 polysulfide reductase NrfD [Ignavibacteriaceae bacterium]NNL22605.1 polysulfide reductase NrfD [Ignavibacteriaceae bacterium]
MLEHALKGTKKYWAWIFSLSVVIVVGVYFYLKQFHFGLGITGLSRDVSWGFYIAQLTFLVGVAASGVMVVLPYYMHDYKQFGKLTILGEFLAIAAVAMCILFVFVDIGQPIRLMNIILYPSPSSILFWDTVVLSGYMLINIVISHVVLDSERKSIPPPKWIKPVIILSIPWAISIHTVTAFLYAGLAARPFWMTAILAPRFLASAFSSGPALLLVLVFVIKKFTSFDPGKEAVQKLALIITYAMAANIFFILMEFFTAFYSSIPEHIHHFQYLYFGLDGHTTLVPWMWASAILGVTALILLFIPKIRKNENYLFIICVAIFVSIWIDKGLGMVVTGFIPNPLGDVVDYWPTIPEAIISLSIWAIGFFLITVFYKIALSVRKEVMT